jgi:hypothetical protein
MREPSSGMRNKNWQRKDFTIIYSKTVTPE